MKSAEERFWDNVSKDGPVPSHRPELGPCWIFGSGRAYPKIRYLGRSELAHRFSLKLSGVDVPDGMFVLHECDNGTGGCVRPSHLRVGTQKDNISDCAKRGRIARGDRHGKRLHPESCPRGNAHYSRTNPEKLARGERNGRRTHPESYLMFLGEGNNRAKITAQIASEIRRRVGLGEAQSSVARSVGVSQYIVSDVVRRKTWRHVP